MNCVFVKTLMFLLLLNISMVINKSHGAQKIQSIFFSQNEIDLNEKSVNQIVVNCIISTSDGNWIIWVNGKKIGLNVKSLPLQISNNIRIISVDKNKIVAEITNLKTKSTKRITVSPDNRIHTGVTEEYSDIIISQQPQMPLSEDDP